MIMIVMGHRPASGVLLEPNGVTDSAQNAHLEALGMTRNKVVSLVASKLIRIKREKVTVNLSKSVISAMKKLQSLLAIQIESAQNVMAYSRLRLMEIKQLHDVESVIFLNI